jgi:hypothetical protein
MKKNIPQFFIILIVITLMSTFALARVEKPIDWESFKIVWGALLDLQGQIDSFFDVFVEIATYEKGILELQNQKNNLTLRVETLEQQSTVECGTGIVINGRCVTGYVPDINCDPTSNPAEVCDGIDNDCDDTIDNGCIADVGSGDTDTNYSAYACLSSWYNGGSTVVGDNSNLFIVEISGSSSAPGTLHKVTSSGTLVSDVNTNIPLGGTGITRANNGKIYAQGANWDTTTIIELDTNTGATIGTVFNGSLHPYVSLRAVDSNGRAYLNYFAAGHNETYRTTGTDTTSYEVVFSSLPFNPLFMVLNLDESKAFFANWKTLGIIDISSGSYTELDTLVGELSFSQLVKDDAGNIYAYISTGYTSFECSFYSIDCTQGLWKYTPAGTNKQLMLDMTHLAPQVAFDFGTNEMVVIADNRYGTPLAGCNDYIAIYRFDPDAIGEPNQYVEQPSSGFIPTCMEGTQLVGNMPDVTCASETCLSW